jgi:hypothetical protein
MTYYVLRVVGKMNRNTGVDQLRDVGEHLGFVRREAP